jgi:hypothetical protein
MTGRDSGSTPEDIKTVYLFDALKAIIMQDKLIEKCYGSVSGHVGTVSWDSCVVKRKNTHRLNPIGPVTPVACYPLY